MNDGMVDRVVDAVGYQAVDLRKVKRSRMLYLIN